MSKAVAKANEGVSFLDTLAPVGAVAEAWEREYAGDGLQDIDNNDINIPRIKLARALTPEVQDGLAQQGDFLLNLTGEVLAASGEPLLIIPLVHEKEYIIWRDRSSGGGIIARARREVQKDGSFKHKWDQPNTQHTDTLGKGKAKVDITYNLLEYVEDNDMHLWDGDNPPLANEHFNYIVMLPEHGNMVAALSLSRTQLGKGRDFNAQIKLTGKAIYQQVYEMTSWKDARGSDEFYNIKFRLVGTTKDQATLSWYRELHQSFRNRAVVNYDDSPAVADEAPVENEAF